MFFGAHVSTSGGMEKAPQNGLSLGCEAIQVFTKNQMQWKAKPLSSEDIARYKTTFKQSGLHVAVSHDSYLINLGSPQDSTLKQSLDAFVDELERCEQLGIPYLVFHPGSHVGSGEKTGLKRIAESLNWVLGQKKGCVTQLLLETTAGQGSNLGYTFEQLAEILDEIRDKDKMGVCVDTCHIFAAGYDLRTPTAYEATFKELHDVIGLKNVKAFHLNDSKKELGSRVDRHENIGNGHLGLEAFRLLVNDRRFEGIPMMLETPGGDEGYRRDLEILKGLRKRSLKAKTKK